MTARDAPKKPGLRYFDAPEKGLTLTSNEAVPHHDETTEHAAGTQPLMTETTNAIDSADTSEQHSHEHESHEHAHRDEAQPTLNPELMREIAVEVDADTVSRAFRTVVKKYQRLARIPGFRVGKVPETVIKNRFSKEVRQEVLDDLVAERFRQTIVEQKLSPISQPQLTNLMLVDGQPLQFKAAFEVLPELDLSGYDTVAVSRPDASLSDAEFEAELARVMDSHGTVEAIAEDRELRDGDWAEIEFKGIIQELAQTVNEDAAIAQKDGATNKDDPEQITGEDVLIEVGGTNTLGAFTEALRGKKIGQEMTFEVTYPAEFGEPKLAGQTVKYDVTVKALKKKTYPEKDEEFAKQLGDYDSWGDFEQKLREHAGGRKKEGVEQAAKEKMLGELISKFQFPVPETFVQQQIDARLDRGLRALAKQGMSADDMRKLDFGRLREAQRDQAVSEVKASLILDKIAEHEGVSISDDEMEREMLMASLQAREPLDTLRERMTRDGSMGRMKEQMRREKTGTVLFEKLAQ